MIAADAMFRIAVGDLVRRRAERHLPLPLTQAPAASLNDQCPGIALSRSEGIERPTPRWNDIVCGNMKIYGSMGSVGYQRDRKTIQRYRETLATSLEVSLFLRPTTEKGFGVEMVRESNQIINFSFREKTPRDIGAIRLRSDVFEIDTDVAGRGDGDEGKTG